MDSRLIFVVIGVIVTTFGLSEAISCYMCAGGTGSDYTGGADTKNCMDPFNKKDIAICSNAALCVKMSGTVSGRRITYVHLYNSHPTISMHYTMPRPENLYSILQSRGLLGAKNHLE